MKVKFLFVIVVMSWMTNAGLFGQTYDVLWKDVERLANKDLPQSVASKAQDIYKKAEAERNVPQMMKAFLTAMKYRAKLSFDSVAVDKASLKRWAESETNVCHQAVLYSLLAETDVENPLLAETDAENRMEYLSRSLRPEDDLLQFDATQLEPIVKRGEESAYMHHSLYDLLARRAQSLMEYDDRWTKADSLYAAMVKAYQRKGWREAALLTKIDQLKYRLQGATQEVRNTCRQEVAQLMAQYADLPECGECYILMNSMIGSEEETIAERLELIHKALKLYPNYKRINELKNAEADIKGPSFVMNSEMLYPNDTTSFVVKYRNLEGFTLKIYEIGLSPESPDLDKVTARNVGKYGKVVWQEDVALPPTPDYKTATHRHTVRMPKAGIYYILPTSNHQHVRGDDMDNGALVQVSALKLVISSSGLQQVHATVVDKRTGHPVTDAGLQLLPYSNGQKEAAGKTLKPNGTGIFDLKNLSGRYRVKAFTATDNAMNQSGLYDYYSAHSPSRVQKQHLFTDRPIYRPGQTVYFSGLTYLQDGDTVRVVPSGTYKVKLKTPDGKDAGSQTLRANDQGTFSGEFVLPVGTQTGRYRVETSLASTPVTVEEYKRPTFEVTMDSLATEYQLGDSVQVTGQATAFSGAPVRNAKVNYHVTMSEFSWFRYNGDHVRTADGQAMTDADGRFSFPVVLKCDDIKPNTLSWYKRFVVDAQVTSEAGETQQSQLAIPLGSSSLQVAIKGFFDKPVWMKGQHGKMSFWVCNLLGKPVLANVQYAIARADGQEVMSGTHVSNEEFEATEIERLPSGTYCMKAKTVDSQGRESNTDEVWFTVFASTDKNIPLHGDDGLWAYATSAEFGDGPVDIYFGATHPDAYLMYEMRYGNGQVEYGVLKAKEAGKMLRKTYRYEARYGDGISWSVCYVKNNEFHHQEFEIRKPVPDKHLDLKWQSFRDKLRPGQQETWTLRITDKQGRPAKAELLAYMYDASLDQLGAPGHEFGLSFPRYVPPIKWTTSNDRLAHTYLSFKVPYLSYPHFQFDELQNPCGNVDMMGTMYLEENIVVGFGRASKSRNAMMAAPGMAMAEDEALFETVAADANVQEPLESMEREEAQPAPMRENFGETAFFYPHLQTDANGETTISFTLPESLTRWHFKGFAHTVGMAYGQLDGNVVAQKDFMLQINMPRFARVGDGLALAASLQNLSAEREVTGTVTMQVFNPMTDEVLESQSQPFSVPAGQSLSVAFPYQVTPEHQMLAVRMLADGGLFSDGEQRYLPVLPDKEWITETRPVSFNTAGTHRFVFTDLFNNHSQTATQKKITVESVGNASWYAIMALPMLDNPVSEDAISWAAAYYANTLAAAFVRQHPKLQQVFQTWKADKQTLVGELLKNEELKNIILAETPWMNEAQDETEQRQRIATLFDVNTMAARLDVVRGRLQAMQLGDGGWNWYKGMQTSRYVTSQVALMLARLQALGAADEATDKMLRQAVHRLEGFAQEECKQLKAHKETNCSEELIRYLHIKALMADDYTATDKWIVERIAKKPGLLTIYGKAASVLMLQKAGKDKDVKDFVKSIMEYSVTTPEMGRYFDTRKAQYSWFSYKIPTQVMVIEALRTVSPDVKVDTELKQWLLKQKQSQQWANAMATADAIYALFTDVEPEADGLDYTKQVFTEQVDQMSEFTFEKRKDGVGWGAVYAQYLEQMDKVRADDNGLRIRRSLYRDGKPVEGALHVGDKVTVRLEITADRDIDFVQVKDQRAACMEPTSVLSGYRWNKGAGYYQAMRDASAIFCMDMMPKGTYMLEYDVFITMKGTYLMGSASIQSAYAPEFAGHTNGLKITVE